MSEEQLNLRTMDNAKAVMKMAKLDVRNLTEVVQALYYPTATELEKNDMKLLELDAHLLKEIREGNYLEFKGGLNEPAVLCSKDKTYEIKIAETSNSLLLIPELKFGAASSKSPLHSPRSGAVNKSLDRSLNDSTEDDAELMAELKLEHKPVLQIFHEYLECREIRPRYDKMKNLLRHTLYSGPENEEFVDRTLLFTGAQLLDTVQCSRLQFEEGVRQCRAIEIDGRLRSLCHTYEYRIINIMVGLIRENSWDLDEIDREETLAALEGIAPQSIVAGLFDLYTSPSVDKTGKYKYSQELVSRIVVQNILQPSLMFRYDEFFCRWQEALPEGMCPNEDYLRYLGVVDNEGNVPCVRALCEEGLPANLQDRMRILFKTKSKWTLEEIEPYIECFSTPTTSVSMLLAKHARSLTEQGVRYYVSKY